MALAGEARPSAALHSAVRATPRPTPVKHETMRRPAQHDDDDSVPPRSPASGWGSGGGSDPDDDFGRSIGDHAAPGFDVMTPGGTRVQFSPDVADDDSSSRGSSGDEGAAHADRQEDDGLADIPEDSPNTYVERYAQLLRDGQAPRGYVRQARREMKDIMARVMEAIGDFDATADAGTRALRGDIDNAAFEKVNSRGETQLTFGDLVSVTRGYLRQLVARLVKSETRQVRELEEALASITELGKRHLQESAEEAKKEGAEEEGSLGAFGATSPPSRQSTSSPAAALAAREAPASQVHVGGVEISVQGGDNRRSSITLRERRAEMNRSASSGALSVLTDVGDVSGTAEDLVEAAKADADEKTQRLSQLFEEQCARLDELVEELEHTRKASEDVRVERKLLQARLRIVERRLQATTRALTTTQSKLAAAEDVVRLKEWSTKKAKEEASKASKERDDLKIQLESATAKLETMDFLAKNSVPAVKLAKVTGELQDAQAKLQILRANVEDANARLKEEVAAREAAHEQRRQSAAMLVEAQQEVAEIAEKKRRTESALRREVTLAEAAAERKVAQLQEKLREATAKEAYARHRKPNRQDSGIPAAVSEEIAKDLQEEMKTLRKRFEAKVEEQSAVIAKLEAEATRMAESHATTVQRIGKASKAARAAEADFSERLAKREVELKAEHAAEMAALRDKFSTQLSDMQRSVSAARRSPSGRKAWESTGGSVSEISSFSPRAVGTPQSQATVSEADALSAMFAVESADGGDSAVAAAEFASSASAGSAIARVGSRGSISTNGPSDARTLGTTATTAGGMTDTDPVPGGASDVQTRILDQAAQCLAAASSRQRSTKAVKKAHKKLRDTVVSGISEYTAKSESVLDAQRAEIEELSTRIAAEHAPCRLEIARLENEVERHQEKVADLSEAIEREKTLVRKLKRQASSKASHTTRLNALRNSYRASKTLLQKRAEEQDKAEAEAAVAAVGTDGSDATASATSAKPDATTSRSDSLPTTDAVTLAVEATATDDAADARRSRESTSHDDESGLQPAGESPSIHPPSPIMTKHRRSVTAADDRDLVENERLQAVTEQGASPQSASTTEATEPPRSTAAEQRAAASRTPVPPSSPIAPAQAEAAEPKSTAAVAVATAIVAVSAATQTEIEAATESPTAAEVAGLKADLQSIKAVLGDTQKRNGLLESEYNAVCGEIAVAHAANAELQTALDDAQRAAREAQLKSFVAASEEATVQAFRRGEALSQPMSPVDPERAVPDSTHSERGVEQRSASYRPKSAPLGGSIGHEHARAQAQLLLDLQARIARQDKQLSEFRRQLVGQTFTRNAGAALRPPKRPQLSTVRAVDADVQTEEDLERNELKRRIHELEGILERMLAEGAVEQRTDADGPHIDETALSLVLHWALTEERKIRSNRALSNWHALIARMKFDQTHRRLVEASAADDDLAPGRGIDVVASHINVGSALRSVHMMQRTAFGSQIVERHSTTTNAIAKVVRTRDRELIALKLAEQTEREPEATTAATEDLNVRTGRVFQYAPILASGDVDVSRVRALAALREALAERARKLRQRPPLLSPTELQRVAAAAALIPRDWSATTALRRRQILAEFVEFVLAGTYLDLEESWRFGDPMRATTKVTRSERRRITDHATADRHHTFVAANAAHGRDIDWQTSLRRYSDETVAAAADVDDGPRIRKGIAIARPQLPSRPASAADATSLELRSAAVGIRDTDGQAPPRGRSLKRQVPKTAGRSRSASASPSRSAARETPFTVLERERKEEAQRREHPPQAVETLPDPITRVEVCTAPVKLRESDHRSGDAAGASGDDSEGVHSAKQGASARKPRPESLKIATTPRQEARRRVPMSPVLRERGDAHSQRPQSASSSLRGWEHEPEVDAVDGVQLPPNQILGHRGWIPGFDGPMATGSPLSSTHRDEGKGAGKPAAAAGPRRPPQRTRLRPRSARWRSGSENYNKRLEASASLVATGRGKPTVRP